MMHRFALVLALVALAQSGCDDRDADPGPFEFRVWANDYTGPDETLEIVVDGQPVVQGNQTLSLAMVQFPDYATALDEGLVVVETRMGDTLLDRCEMKPGACGSECVPTFETSSVCIGPDGRIGLNTYDCPCGGPIRDWFCDGDCAITGP